MHFDMFCFIVMLFRMELLIVLVEAGFRVYLFFMHKANEAELYSPRLVSAPSPTSGAESQG